ncbi:hypothetical protein [Comamonas serinivorans]|uniref:hypothetical protein n=1 Tax=Comamonas serinivorans TaxID=1082851 RepID=UPI0012F79459|nr:hypothetical protein [Comamonas serinivorans]
MQWNASKSAAMTGGASGLAVAQALRGVSVRIGAARDPVHPPVHHRPRPVPHIQLGQTARERAPHAQGRHHRRRWRHPHAAMLMSVTQYAWITVGTLTAMP